MKLINKLGIGITAASILFAVGCSTTQYYSEESLGLRKVDLYSENTVTPDETQYGKDTAGTSKTINRAFQDAPPMIPHDVEGMLPITISSNQCLDCHAPEVAPSMNALPYPPSHMMNFRGNSRAVGGANTSSADMKDVSIKKLSQLSGARFNCSQCHAPQSNMKAIVENTFEPDFTSKNGASKSAWTGGSLTEGLDTLAE
jgi:cytochrome c-type protein NapB